MIETLYIDERLAFSDRPTWGGAEVGRHEVLPIWRHKYAAAVGLPVDDGFSADAFTAATPTHSFSIAGYLKSDAKEFVLCVEINRANDITEAYPDAPLGAPSLLYTALYDEWSGDYQLLILTAHGGGGAASNGELNDDLASPGDSARLAEKILARVGRAAEPAS